MKCWGRQCNLGWGYDEILDQIIPAGGEFHDFSAYDKYEWEYDNNYLLSNDIDTQVNIYWIK